MFRLTREIRIQLSAPGGGGGGFNGHAGGAFPSGVGAFVALRATLQGEPARASSYLCNVKEIDRAVRAGAAEVLQDVVASRAAPASAVSRIARGLTEKFASQSLHDVVLVLSPYSSVQAVIAELPMIRLSQRYEFSASHRLHNPSLDDAANLATFGKCNNPRGHGHNYELQVTLAGVPDSSGAVIAPSELDRIVNECVIEPLDHKHLNAEVQEFAALNPTVENIAMVIFRRLKGRFSATRAGLASVTVWETPRTWCEYSE